MRLHPFLVVLASVTVLSTGAFAQDKIPYAPGAAPVQAFDPAVQISEYVREVFQDRDGQFWFGTNSDGVCRYDGTSLTYLSVEQGFGGHAVRGILQDGDGAMWFATDGGVSRYENGKFTNYTVANGLSDNQVWSLMRDRAGVIWVGTQEGVCRFDGKGFVAVPLPRVEVEHPASRFTPKVVFGMFQDQAGNIWFGTDGEGAHRYDGKGFTSYTTKEGLADNQVRSIYGDRQGRIWLGTDGGGVSRYDGGVFTTYTKKDGLNNDRVFEILEDKAGNMWFSTLGAGACRYDGKTFTAFREDRGLTRSHVQSMCQDRDGVLWFGCSGGLFRLDGERFVNVTRNGPWPVRAHTEAADPMAPFARLIGGEWRVTAASGTSMFHTWNWGPGKHSVRVMTDGSGASGQPWRALQVYYWHPGRKRVCVWGASPYARSVSEGTIHFEGEAADGAMDLYQTGGNRKMGLRWTFDGPDRYRDTLLEDSGKGFETLVEFDQVRSRTTAARTPERAAPEHSDRLNALEPLWGVWEAKGEWAKTSALHVQTTVEWVPYADAIYARVMALDAAGAPLHLLDAYVYHHTGANVLRCLALSNAGGVYEGDVAVLGGGVVQLALKGYEGEAVTQRLLRFDLERDGGVRNRAWIREGADPVLDVQHTKVRK